MKQNLFNKLWLRVGMIVAIMTTALSGTAWAESETITFAELGLENGVQYTDPFGTNISVTFGGGGNDGKYYTTGSGIRTYGDGTITIGAKGNTITGISTTFSGESYAPAAAESVWSSNGTGTGTSGISASWSGSATEVVMTRPSASGHWRLQSITVTYTTGDTPSGNVNVTLTQSNLELTGSYSSNTSKTISGITYVHTDLMKNSSNIQAKASTGTIKNTTAYPGDITSVVITHSGTGRATTINGSADGENWTQVATGNGSITADFAGKGYKYFQITRGSNAAYWEKIEINYSTSTNPTCAMPTFTPAAGSYIGTQNITISCATDDATIYYTTDGTVPTEESDEYTSAITVSSTTTIKAIAVADGYEKSSVAEATYTIVSLEHAGTEADPYTIADAYAAIDGNVGITDVCVTGVISQVDSYNSQYNSITYWISSDGTTTSDQLEVYGGLNFEDEDPFSSIDDLAVGDEVVVKGTLKKYGNTYEFDKDNRLVSLSREQHAATIPVEDSEVAFGSTFTIDASTILGGAITVTSSNTNVATVEGLVITPVAVGTTTITVATAETDAYYAGSATFTLTVTAPEGREVAAFATEEIVLDFTDNTEWNFPVTYEKGSGTYTSGNYTIIVGESSTGHKFDETNQYFIMGKEGASLTLPAFDKDVIKIEVIGRAGASGSVLQNIYVGETAVSTETTGATGTNVYEIASDYQAAGTIYTLRVVSAHNTQITQIKITFRVVADPITYTIPSSGLGTFCSEYPLDLSTLPEGVKAYIVTEYTATSVKLTQIETAVKGGTGLVIEGTGGTDVEFESVDCSTVPENELVGTLAPTYLAANTVYGLKSGQFHPNNAGTIGKNRAYLPAKNGTAVKPLTIEFDDATGITRTRIFTDEETIYNLAGQRLNKMQKGINIVNGKKILK